VKKKVTGPIDILNNRVKALRSLPNLGMTTFQSIVILSIAEGSYTLAVKTAHTS
jgi:hypothetical protein